MEPLKPSTRAALKRAHPGLDDATIDHHEALLVQRQGLHPIRDAERIRELDAERRRLLAERMPRFREVVLEEQRNRPARPAKRPPIVRDI